MTIEEVESLLQDVNPHQSTGSDAIPGIVLKNAANVLALSLQPIFMTALLILLFSQAVPIFHVSLLFKAGDRSSPSNYRPVFLLPIMFRLLESLVKGRFVQYFSNRKLLPPSQFAYRHNHSTEDALLLAINRWLAAKANRDTTGIVLLDMSKASDRVQHQRLLSVLFDHGLAGPVLRWFRKY